MAVPDGGYGWFIVLASFLMTFVVVGVPRCFGVVYVVILEKFSTNATTAAWIHSLFNALRMLLGPLSSVLCKRFTARKVVVCGGIVMSIGFIGCSFSTNVYQIYVTYGVIGGIGGAFLFTPSLVVIGDYFDKKKGKAMSVSTLGGGIGTMSLAPLLSFLMNYYGFLGGFLILGGISLHCVVGGMLLRPINKKNKQKMHVFVIAEFSSKQNAENIVPNGQSQKQIMGNDHSKEVAKLNEKDEIPQNPQISKTSEKTREMEDKYSCKSLHKEKQSEIKDKDRCKSLPRERHKNIRKCIPKLLHNRTFLLYCFVFATMPFCIMVVLLFIADFAKEQSLNLTERALLISVMGACDIVGRLVAGVLFDLKAIQHRRSIIEYCLGIMLGLATVCISVGHSKWLLFLVCSVQMFIEGMFHSQRATIISEFVPEHQVALAIGWITFSQGIGNLVGPIIGGLIRDYMESYEEVFIIGGSIFIVTTCASLVNDLISHQTCRYQKYVVNTSHI